MWFLWIVVLLLAVLAGLYIYSILKGREAERRYPPIGRFLTVEGTRLHYVRRGSRIPVVLLHGHDGFLQDWTLTVFDRLARQYDVIAFDRPGHGYSDRPQDCSTPAAQAKLIHAALRQLGVQKPLLLGHSWSGALVLAYALEFPDEARAVVLLAGAVYGSDAPLPWFVRLPLTPLLGPIVARTLWPPLSRAVIRQLIGKAYHPEPIRQEYLQTALALWQRNPRLIRAWAEDVQGQLRGNTSLSRHYARVKLPVVIVNGDSDLEVPAQTGAIPLHNQISHSRLTILHDAGHEIPHTRPEAVIEAIGAALAPDAAA